MPQASANTVDKLPGFISYFFIHFVSIGILLAGQSANLLRMTYLEPDPQLLALALHHHGHHGRAWTPYYVVGREAQGLYVETLWQPFRWDELAMRWPLEPGELLVTVQSGQVRVLRQAPQVDALTGPAAARLVI